MESGKPKAVVIAGPTASGKTSLSVDLALALEGEIINADSMQVYRGMDIGTAKPSIQERGNIHHHLLDIVDPDEEFNAATYRNMALPIVDDINRRGKVCFIVGGSGLYIKGLMEGLFECPPVNMKLRESLRRECEMLGSARLHYRLSIIDPECACKIHPNDKVRITRALEIVHLTNRCPSELSRVHGFGDKKINALKFCLEVDREELYNNINVRSVAMVEGGLAEETEILLKKGYSPDLKPMRAIGYRHMVKYLKGDWSYKEAINNIQIDTRRYAKRQLTWFSGDSGFTWIAPENIDFALRSIRVFVNK
ncbi:MAG TPA: tRNA (adenosine(37)-N6)-dimethylallyltransferase MiaA [Desulfobacteraceae bacterium]|nr:tRNA (adenosine(37)-N6)-dimethylallyltransferase MiaA [Desulfobacteraceae bacterium]